MKIAFVCPDDLSTLIFCKGLINDLRKDKRYIIYTISNVDEYKAEIEALGVNHIPIDMQRFVNPLKDLLYLFALYKIFRSHKFNIVVCWTTKPNIYGTISARLAGIKNIMFSVRGLGSAFLDEARMKRKLLKWIVLKLYWLACKLSKKVWFTNENDLKYFLSRSMLTPQKVVLTKNCVNIEDFSPFSVSKNKLIELRREIGLGDQDQIVLMVARMIWPKGIRQFVEAARILKERYPQLKFMLVGPLDKGSPRNVPETYLREAEKNENFLWIGLRKDVKELYALADLAVLPSFYKEGGYPRALLEPMAMGKPVITTDIEDCRGPVEEGKNGYLIPVRDSEALANAIELLINDNNKRKEFGRYSRLKIEREFDEKKVVEKIATELYQLSEAEIE